MEHDLIHHFPSEALLEVAKNRDLETRQWQKDTFPQDPVLLYQLLVIDKSSNFENNTAYYYAIPTDDISNPDASSTLVFFDIIEQDKVVEKAFVGCTVIITKVAFSTIEELLAAPNAPVVFDGEYNAARASKVLLGLLGIIR